MAKTSEGPVPLEHDPFLRGSYDSLNSSVFQQKLSRIRPMPFGVVFLPYPGVTEQGIREHFRTIRGLGFNSIKQFMANPEWSIARLREIALEEGLIPWTYGEAGWEDPTPDLLKRLGLPADMEMQDVRSNSIFLAHQKTVLADRILQESESKDEDRCRVDERKLARSSPVKRPTRMEDTYHHNGPGIPEEHRQLFFEWLQTRYQNIDALNEAWNLEHVGIGRHLMADWDDLALCYHEVSPTEYRHILDQLRFKADMAIARVREDRDKQRKLDPHAPCRIGGELGMLLPHAWWGIDLEGLARLMADSGSFYPSIHLAWHFEETDFEFVRPVYMQASYAVDLFKGGWSATWESTGGPQQFSGGKGPANDPLQKIAAFTVHEGTMTQLLLSYLAAGLRGVGLWTWNARTAGWEAGEYALLDRNNQVTTRAIRTGLIAKAANRYRDELWDARKEPLVGIFQDWDNDAIWAAISVSNRDQFRLWPARSRIGASRSLINQNIPFEYVTASNLREGLANRYASIYLPAIAGLAQDLLPTLRLYVEGGGRLVLDAPGSWFDTFGRVPPTGHGSEFERLFGATLDDFQHSGNVRYSVEGHEIEGFVATVTPTTGKVIRTMDHGAPLIIEHRLGEGAAVLATTSLSMTTFGQGHVFFENLLAQIALGGTAKPFKCEGAIAYRLASPAADHYFLINDGPAATARLSFAGVSYTSFRDAMSGKTLDDTEAIPLEADGGRWIRCQKP